jgi:hypothetical protein
MGCRPPIRFGGGRNHPHPRSELGVAWPPPKYSSGWPATPEGVWGWRDHPWLHILAGRPVN